MIVTFDECGRRQIGFDPELFSHRHQAVRRFLHAIRRHYALLRNRLVDDPSTTTTIHRFRSIVSIGVDAPVGPVRPFRLVQHGWARVSEQA
jgi:hypothetical protein